MEKIRRRLQIIFAFLTNGYWGFPFSRAIYQGPLKVICSPGLNCYSCPASTTYCPMGALQQLIAGVRLSLEMGQFYFGWYVIGSIGVLGGLLGRMVCGWMCPFGLFQELLYRIPVRKFGIPAFMKYGKFAILALMVVILPLFVVDDFGAGDPWFCKYLCPAGTLEAGIPMLILQPDLRQTVGWLFFNKLFFMFVFIGWSVVASRPFCRTACPLGAFYGLFARVKLVRLTLEEERCTRCRACHQVCPMGVKFNEEPQDSNCISCMRCQRICPYGAIHLEVGSCRLGTAPGRIGPAKEC